MGQNILNNFCFISRFKIVGSAAVSRPFHSTNPLKEGPQPGLQYYTLKILLLESRTRGKKRLEREQGKRKTFRNVPKLQSSKAFCPFWAKKKKKSTTQKRKQCLQLFNSPNHGKWSNQSEGHVTTIESSAVIIHGATNENPPPPRFKKKKKKNSKKKRISISISIAGRLFSYHVKTIR
jgi:hypothetical protein